MRDADYPIFFFDRTCVHCGAENSVVMIDKFGKEIKDETVRINPVSHMKCKKCGREYFIMWDTDEANEFSKPIAISKNYIDYFSQLLDDGK